jgi:putative ABC transport system ATP-binding protein
MAKKKLIEAKDVHKYFKLGETQVHALRGVSLTINEGDFIFIVGPSGSGKSTLMHLLGALDHPTKGKIMFEGRNLAELDDEVLSAIRRKKMGFIFQAFNLMQTLSATENVSIPLVPAGVNEEEAEERAIKFLTLLGLGDRTHHKPAQLSGGQQQRVAIARALINDPKLILADEPTGEVDSKTGNEIFSYLREMNKKYNKTFIIVTHDTEYIKKGDKIFKIHDGKIVR